PSDLSLPVTLASPSGTSAFQAPSALAAGTVSLHAVLPILSLTVKVVVQVALLPAASVAVTVITCAPRPTTVPATGFWLKVIALGALQLSRTVTLASTSGNAACRVPSTLAAGIAAQLRLGFL